MYRDGELISDINIKGEKVLGSSWLYRKEGA
jgi:hypothetical protein